MRLISQCPDELRYVCICDEATTERCRTRGWEFLDDIIEVNVLGTSVHQFCLSLGMSFRNIYHLQQKYSLIFRRIQVLFGEVASEVLSTSCLPSQCYWPDSTSNPIGTDGQESELELDEKRTALPIG